MRRALLLVVAVGSALPSPGCDRTQADEGLDALLQVANAQFFREPLPAGEAGPKVVSATLGGRATANTAERSCSGELERSATAAAIAMPSDVGYWIVRAGIPLSSAPTSPTFEAVFGISGRTPVGSTQLVFRAVDGDGRFGPPVVRPLEIGQQVRPTGRLVISLSWNNQADLDLHVVLPSGIELFKRRRTEYERPPPGAGPVPANAPTDGGVLDRDSNAACVFDGQRAENAIWAETPPSGHYLVRVDTSALCGAATAIWRVEATLDGQRIGSASGTTTENDLRFDHGRGAGVLAVELDVP